MGSLAGKPGHAGFVGRCLPSSEHVELGDWEQGARWEDLQETPLPRTAGSAIVSGQVRLCTEGIRNLCALGGGGLEGSANVCVLLAPVVESG